VLFKCDYNVVSERRVNGAWFGFSASQVSCAIKLISCRSITCCRGQARWWCLRSVVLSDGNASNSVLIILFDRRRYEVSISAT